MTPAQRRKKLHDLKNKKTSKKFNKFFIFLFFIVFLILGLYLFDNKHCFGKLKISMVFPDNNGNIVVATFNKNDKEITLITIPSNTQLESSRQLGSWKAQSLWQLGVNEKYNGRLMQETVTKNFHFPISIWADSNAHGFVSGNFIRLLKSTIFPYKSNLSMGDRISLFFINIGIQNEKINSYDLSEVGVLKSKRLTDGEEGFVLIKDVPMNILSSFSEPVDSEEGYLVQIINTTGSRGIAENIGKTIESMGFKITSIREEFLPNNEIDCVVYGKNKDIVQKISLIYSCKVKDDDSEEFDVVIKLGSIFAKRF